MSLKAVLTILLASVVLVVGVLVTELIQITSFLDQEAKTISATAESIHASEELQHHLLIHSRDTYLNILEHQPLKALDRETVQRETFELLRLTEQYIGSEQEKKLVSEVRAAVSDYLNLGKHLDNLNLPTHAKYQKLRESVDKTVGFIDQLIDLNIRQAREAQANVDVQSRMAGRPRNRKIK
jgi:hypothetical protein